MVGSYRLQPDKLDEHGASAEPLASGGVVGVGWPPPSPRMRHEVQGRPTTKRRLARQLRHNEHGRPWGAPERQHCPISAKDRRDQPLGLSLVFAAVERGHDAQHK